MYVCMHGLMNGGRDGWMDALTITSWIFYQYIWLMVLCSVARRLIECHSHSYDCDSFLFIIVDPRHHLSAESMHSSS